MVLRCERTGTDDFRLPVALKVFSPEVYVCADDYESDMQRVASVAMRVAQLQSHQLLDIHNFIECDRVRVMVMEWVNGYDLSHLLNSKMLEALRSSVIGPLWAYLNDVVVASGPRQSRLKPGIAIQILKSCLAGLASLHRAGVVHGDIKPANIMLNRTGGVKLVDFGSAVDLEVARSRIAWTPTYAAPEILDGAAVSPRSDLASLGYVLIEMLSGRVLFEGNDSIETLRAKKLRVPSKLASLLPPDVARNRELVGLCRALVNPDPDRRMASAEEANIEWAAKVHRQLVKTGLDSEYENDLRVWVERLPTPNPAKNSTPEKTALRGAPASLPSNWTVLSRQSTVLD